MDERTESIDSYPSASHTKAREGEVKLGLKDAGQNLACGAQDWMRLPDIVVLGHEGILSETELGAHHVDNA